MTSDSGITRGQAGAPGGIARRSLVSALARLRAAGAATWQEMRNWLADIVAEGDWAVRLGRRSVRWVRDRPGPLVALALCLGLLLPLWLVSSQAFWVGIYEGVHLYQVWGVVVALAGVAYLSLGAWRHHQTGLDQYHPRTGTAAAVVLLVTGSVLLARTAADWTVGWVAASCGLLALTAVALVIGVMGYTEVWRTLLNSKVLEELRKWLEGWLAHRKKTKL